MSFTLLCRHDLLSVVREAGSTLMNGLNALAVRPFETRSASAVAFLMMLSVDVVRGMQKQNSAVTRVRGQGMTLTLNSVMG